MSAPKVPKPASPQSVAASQMGINQAALTGTQSAQQTGQATPYGGLQYIQTGVDANGVPQFTAISQLSPEQQAILGNLQGTQQTLGDTGNALSTAASGMYQQPPDFSETAGTQTKINMDRQLAYLTPYFTQQGEQLDNQLRNQGLVPGSQAYDRAMRTMQDNQNQSIMKFLNDTQGQSFQQAVTQFEQPLKTLGGIFGLTQPASLPSNLINTPKPALAGADFVGANTAYNQAQMQVYQAKLAQHNAMMQGIFGIASTAMGMPGMTMGSIGGMTGAPSMTPMGV